MESGADVLTMLLIEQGRVVTGKAIDSQGDNIQKS